MKLQRNGDGVTIDAEDLGELFGLAPADVPALMKSGEVTSRFEEGAGEDSGRFRVTFFHNGREIRLTCAADGTVRSRFRQSRVR